MNSKTLWSETMLEMLIFALRKQKHDREIREILTELRAKGYRRGELVSRASERIDENAAWRVRRLVA